MSEMAPPVVIFKKGPRARPQQSRKRSASPTDPSSSSASSSVIRPEKKSLLNPLIQGTKRRRDAAEEIGGGLDELDYKADSGSLQKGDELATRSTDWDLELEGGGKGEIGGKKVKLNEVGGHSFQAVRAVEPHTDTPLSSCQDGEIDDGLYHGTANYLSHIALRPDSISSKMKTGPIRATSNIRTITLIDYQPDVCKDYKETGFCGYGDSCKFLHDRGDYLAGWQLDAQFEAGKNAVAAQQEEEEEVPFACLICRKEFTEPVVTKCGHYFCMNCAIQRFIKSPKCYACGAATSGIFNKAEKILAKLEAKRDRQREERGYNPDEEEGDGGIEIGGGSGDEAEAEGEAEAGGDGAPEDSGED
ncbi:hypothetical protein P7C73_g5414, partial [Tremellales sp. Uapishka_1]